MKKNFDRLYSDYSGKIELIATTAVLMLSAWVVWVTLQYAILV